MQKLGRAARNTFAVLMAGAASVFFSYQLSGCSAGNGSRYEQAMIQDTVYVSRMELERQMRLKGDEIEDMARLREKIGPLSGRGLRTYWWIFMGNLEQGKKHVSGDSCKIAMDDLRNGYMRDAGIEAIGDLYGAGDAALVWGMGTAAIEDASFEKGAKKQIRK